MSARVHTVYGREALCRRLHQLAAKADTISFDIFDTLLVRRIDEPDRIKMATARYIAQRARHGDRPWTPERIQRLRDKIEALHRRRTARHHADHEARYPDFMKDTLCRIFGETAGTALLPEVMNHELAMESAFLVARDDLLSLAGEWRRQGKRILAISDMYLPASALRILLDRAGFAAVVDRVFSSADRFEAKASGAAWPRIQAETGAVPARWLHVGDNPISDGTRPAAFGVTACVLRDAREHQRHALLRTYRDIARYRPYWRGRYAQQIMLPLEAENRPRPDLYLDGRHYLGPLLCAFVHHVAEQCLERNIRRVYFLAREGELLRDIWRRVTPRLYAGSPLPDDHYLYVSRMALAGPSCTPHGLSHENARIAFLPATNRDFRDLCRVFSLDPDPLQPFLRRHGLRNDTPLSRWHDGWAPQNGERFRHMIETDADVQAEVRRQTAPAHQALHAYLESERFFDPGPVALVDIGWLGTIQRFLHQAVATRPDHPDMFGHLLVCAAGYPFPESPDNRIEGFFHDHRRFDFCGSLALYAQDLFEETTRAAHPGLMAYAPDADRGFRLVFRAEDDDCARNEQRQSAYFAPVRQGILDAADRYGPTMAVLGDAAREWKPWLNAQTVNRMAFPRTREVARLTHIHHLDDFGSTRQPSRRARRALRRLWNRPLWQLRWLPGLRAYEYLKFAVHWLRA